MRNKVIVLIASIIFLIGFFVFQLVLFSDGKLHVVFCDVGQGDGIYIRTPKGSDIVIDAGRDSSIIKCLEENMPFWDRSIELVFATHPDADHIGGFIYILNSYQVKSYNTVKLEKKTGVFDEIKKLLKEKKIPVRYLTRGDTYKLDSELSLKTLWPTHDFIKEGDSDSNRYSLVQVLKYKDFDTLFTGDIDFDILNGILEENTGSKGGRGSLVDFEIIEVLKLPHHGSRTGINSSTFNFIKPQLSIISSGKNNSYGHPHKEVPKEFGKYNIKYLNTANVGEIEIVTDGNSMNL